MAPEKKRKRPQDSPAGKSKPPPKSVPEGFKKRLKPSTTASGDKALIPAPSALRDDEASFPRGGASALTPLEHKEVANEAMKDALFEAGGTTAPSSLIAASTQKKQQQRHSDRKKEKKGDVNEKKEKDTGPKVEGLSYKVCAGVFVVIWLLWLLIAGCWL